MQIHQVNDPRKFCGETALSTMSIASFFSGGISLSDNIISYIDMCTHARAQLPNME